GGGGGGACWARSGAPSSTFGYMAMAWRRRGTGAIGIVAAASPARARERERESLKGGRIFGALRLRAGGDCPARVAL
ncbi:unnamed protein product, partial [Urochloa humidicola]